VFEMLSTRTIESNDGRRIVEVRHFEKRRMVKLLTGAEHLSLELGPPHTLPLDPLVHFDPKDDPVELPAEAVAEAILKDPLPSFGDGPVGKALVRTDSLSGKRVRITYVDGLGVESVEPLGCDLTSSELAFLFNAAVLSDCYLFPGEGGRRRGKWQVDAGQLVDFLDPAFRAVPRGKILFFGKKSPDGLLQGKPPTVATADLLFADAPSFQSACFDSRGVVRRSLDHDFVETVSLEGRLYLLGVSQDYFLFDEVLGSHPKLVISYACRAR